MKNDRCAINFEIFLLDILSCKGAIKKVAFLIVVTTFQKIFKDRYQKNRSLKRSN